MRRKVKLADMVEALEFTDDECVYFYHIPTQRFRYLADRYSFGWEDEMKELAEDIEENYDDYLRLPTKFDINEYHIMEQFVWDLPEGSKQDRLEYAISGRGAFRRFKDAICDMGLEQRWYKYRDAAYEQIAIRWCEENEVEFER